MIRIVFALLGLILASHVECQGQSQRPPNIVVILADDLGYGDLGCYGQTIIKTPRLDQMAAEGVRFTDFYAASAVCAPSRCSLITGLHTGHCFIRDNREVQPEGQFPIPEQAVTIFELFKQAGYTTAVMGKWGLGAPGSSGDPVNQGVDLFYGYNCQRQAHNYYPTHLWRNNKREPLEGHVKGNLTGAHYSHDLIVQEALTFIRERAGTPFLLFLPVTIPHVALQVPEDSLAQYRDIEDAPYDGSSGYLPHPTPHAAYAGMVSRLDRDVGRLLDLLAELKLDDNTLVIFTSDNGPTHGRVGGADSAFFKSAGGFRGLKGSLYEGGIRVPFIARWPGQIQPGTISNVPAVGYDLLPTLLGCAGFARLIPEHADGQNLAETLTGVGNPEERPIFWEFPGYGGQHAVRSGRWKLIRTGMHKGPVVSQLFDLRDDPSERRDLAAQEPEVVLKLEAMLRSQHRDSPEFPFAAIDQPKAP